MRWETEAETTWSESRLRLTLATLAAVLLAGCGNYSTEDLRFLAALPTRADLEITPPAQATGVRLEGVAAATAACTSGSADVWLSARPTSDGLNAGVDFVLALVDVVRRAPPNGREENLRRWGPFPDEKHPGREIQVVMTRWFPTGDDAHPAHAYRFEARLAGTPTFDPVILGTFEGASASRGRGGVVLDFERMWTLGLADPSTPHGRMEIGYDRASDPVTIDLVLTQQGFGVEQFQYGYAGFRAGGGRFDFRIRTAANDVLTIATGYDAAGAGRARVAFLAGAGGAGSFDECWDPASCLTWLDDPAGFVCGVPGCTRGALAACVAVPAPAPF